MVKPILIILCNLLFLGYSQAQSSFAESCIGTWKGMMMLYSQGSLKDSVAVVLTVAKTAAPMAWTWKTEYLSAKQPVVKDYVLRLKDAAKNLYVTDEGGGIELIDYLFANKLYSVFETHNIVLTSTYELKGGELIFEVTSGKKQAIPNQEVTSYSVDSLQRIVFKKVN